MKYFSLLILFFSASVFAQSPCKPPEIVFNKGTFNLFNEEQEMHLGEAFAEYVSRDSQIIDDPAVNKYLRSVGDKIVKNLPPTNIKFSFYVTDEPELNAHAAAGGRIYVTRKMIAFLRSEDELAGILGHELGHAIVRHHSADISKGFKEVLKVESVGDRKDVFEKFNLLIERQMTKRVRVNRNHMDNQQLEADRIGLFAMAASGYNPDAFASAWERLAEVDRNKLGSGFFSSDSPDEKRLREVIKAMGKMPPECVKNAPVSNEDFLGWQTFVTTSSSFAKTEKLPGLLSKGQLNPYLRGDITHIRFSPDGNYVIAQDDSGINVVKRDPFSIIFRIPVKEAKFADFSPDSKNVVFQTYGLRVEKWNIEDRKPFFAREVFVKGGGCWQSELSPDATKLACFSYDSSLRLIDVATGEHIIKKDKFYEPEYLEYVRWNRLIEESGKKEIEPFQMAFSPDGKYFLCGRVARIANPFTERYSGSSKFFAYDTVQKTDVKVGDDLKDFIALPFAFMPNGSIVGQHRIDREKSGIVEFPSGKRISKFFLNVDFIMPTRTGSYLIVGPIKKQAAGILDINANRFLGGNKTPAVDVYDKYIVSEDKDGKLGLFEISADQKTATELSYIQLPKNDLGKLRSLALTPDLSAIALSESSRGGIWSLANGRQALYITGFNGAVFKDDFKVYADFPASGDQTRAMGLLDPVKNAATRLGDIETRRTRQYGPYLIRMKGQNEDKIGKDVPELQDDEVESKNSGADIAILPFFSARISDLFVTRRSTMEVYGADDRKLLWSKEFTDEDPKYQFDASGERIILSWHTWLEAPKKEAKKDPLLKAKFDAMGSKVGDYFIRVLDAKTGSVIKDILIETGEGSFVVERLQSAGDWLIINDDENRILAYSLQTGELKHRFFGDNSVPNSANDTIAIENYPGHLAIYSLKTGQKIDELVFTNYISHAAFSRDNKRLFVLTADQNFYIFNAASFAAK